jgi:molybdenum cofactor biosynthesis enzyme MoaA
MDIRYVVATNCNADFYFCLNEYVGTKSSKKSLTPKDYGDLSIIAKKLGVGQCTISGGEPTLREDLEKIVLEINLSGFKQTISENLNLCEIYNNSCLEDTVFKLYGKII